MGKQTAVAMTDVDEVEFIAFLRSCGEMRILQVFAPTKEAFLVDHFDSREDGNWQYFIWNTQFEAELKFGEVSKEVTGPYKDYLYLAETSSAPFIEYDRHNFNDKEGRTYGCVYWAKCSNREGEFLYDIEAFGRWYDTVVRWIRKNGKQRTKGAYNVYYLPDARAKLAGESEQSLATTRAD